MVQNIEMLCFAPPHPNPLPRGEREFPDENYLAIPASFINSPLDLSSLARY